MSFEETLIAVVKQAVREEIRAALAEQQRLVASDFLTLDQAAKAANVSKSTVKNWLKKGRLPSTGSGRLRRVRFEDLRAVLDAGVRAERPENETADLVAERIMKGIPRRH